jgi:hypothetical protein
MTREQEQAIIERGKGNYMCLAGLEKHDQELVQYFREHRRDVGMYDGGDVLCKRIGTCTLNCRTSVYRLRPDYTLPEPVRYWLVPNDADTYRLQKGAVEPQEFGTLEITEGYHNDLDASCPGDGWALRMVEVGDRFQFLRAKGQMTRAPGSLGLDDEGKHDRGIRWVKDKEPAGEWVVCEVSSSTHSGEWYTFVVCGEIEVLDLAPRIRGFGGIQYERPGGTRTSFVSLMGCVENDRPLKPVAVRFWKEAK